MIDDIAEHGDWYRKGKRFRIPKLSNKRWTIIIQVLMDPKSCDTIRIHRDRLAVRSKGGYWHVGMFDSMPSWWKYYFNIIVYLPVFSLLDTIRVSFTEQTLSTESVSCCWQLSHRVHGVWEIIQHCHHMCRDLSSVCPFLFESISTCTDKKPKSNHSLPMTYQVI